MALTLETAERLAKLCGMFGSAHAGERAAAAAKAHDLIRSLRLTWFDVIAPPPAISRRRREPDSRAPKASRRKPKTTEAKLARLRESFTTHPDLLTDWECKFVLGLSCCRKLSEKQEQVLDEIVEKLRLHETECGGC